MDRGDLDELAHDINEVTDPEATHALDKVHNCLVNLHNELERLQRRIAQLEERANR